MLAAAGCLASSSILSIYIYREKVGPNTMLALRYVGAAAMLWLFYLLSKDWRPYIHLTSRRQFWGCVAVAVANSFSQSFYSIGLLKLDPGLAQMIFSFNPAITALILFFFGESLTPLKIVRLALALLGLYFLTQSSSGKPVELVSVLLIVGCAIPYAIHLVLYQKLLAGTHSRTNTLYIISIMTGIYLTIEMVLHGPGATMAVSGLAWLYIMIMALVSTAFARLLMFAGVGLIGGTQVSLIGIAEPVLVLFSSIVWLGERLSPGQWLGAGLVMVSLALAGLVKSSSINMTIFKRKEQA